MSTRTLDHHPASLFRSDKTPAQQTIELSHALELIVQGRDADAYIDSREPHPADGYAVKLPVWAILPPNTEVGRKGANGQELPARIEWDTPTVVLLADGTATTYSWRMRGLGHTGSGKMTIDLTGAVPSITGTPPGAAEPVLERSGTRASRIRFLHLTSTRGRTARWTLTASLERFVKAKLEDKNYAIAYELGDGSGMDSGRRRARTVVDEHILDAIHTDMVYGADGPSPVSRMIDRCLNPGTFVSVDPLRYVRVAITARAEEAIRRSIGDPKVGPKVRRVMKASGAKSIDQLIDEYRKHYPDDHLARKRAIAALTAGPLLEVRQEYLADIDQAGDRIPGAEPGSA